MKTIFLILCALCLSSCTFERTTEPMLMNDNYYDVPTFKIYFDNLEKPIESEHERSNPERNPAESQGRDSVSVKEERTALQPKDRGVSSCADEGCFLCSPVGE